MFADDPLDGDGKGLAVVLGASGGLGHAIAQTLEHRQSFARVLRLSRGGVSPFDITDERSVVSAAERIAAAGPLRLVIDATGFLHDERFRPEKSLRDIDPDHMAHAFAVNAIGPALAMKHLLPLLARDRRCVFVTLSAKVGSIADNRLGGWYGYRASKAALNQIVRTAAVELTRRAPQSAVAAMHPGTTATDLSKPFAKSGLKVRTPDEAAERIVKTSLRLTAQDSGAFMDAEGGRLPW